MSKQDVRVDSRILANPQRWGEAIFLAIEQLIEANGENSDKRHAVELAIVAVELPHGRRDATIATLIQMAHHRKRNELLYKIVLSGEILDVELVKHGIAEFLDRAQTQPWLLTEKYELSSWLRLLPFTNCPTESLAIIESLPAHCRGGDWLQEFLQALAFAPDPDAEELLFRLATVYPSLYEHYEWRNAVMSRGTPSCALRIAKIAAQGAFDSMSLEMSIWLAGLIEENSEVREQVYDLMDDTSLPGLALLAKVVADCADERGVLLLTRLEQKLQMRPCVPQNT